MLAQEEARTSGHTSIRPVHILMGVFREEEGLGSRALVAEGFNEQQIRDVYPPREIDILNLDDLTVDQRVKFIRERGQSQIPFTPEAKKVLENALREALSLGHNYIGTEHILLALVRQGDDLDVNPMFVAMGLEPYVTRGKLRDQVIKSLCATGRKVKQKDQVKAPVDPPDYLQIAAMHLIQCARALLNVAEEAVNPDRKP